MRQKKQKKTMLTESANYNLKFLLSKRKRIRLKGREPLSSKIEKSLSSEFRTSRKTLQFSFKN